MREIKFRAWNPKAQQLRARGDSNPYTISVGFIYDSNPGKSLFFELAHKGEMLVQQYTGLKDKNGVEIYEGDYVTLHDDQGRPVGHGPVSFRDASFFVYDDYMSLTETAHGHGSVEVIGNIYENPELLKQN